MKTEAESCDCLLYVQPDGLRLRAIGRIKMLKELNGETVTDSERNAALRMAAGSRISQVCTQCIC